jgi:hypothetical protein
VIESPAQILVALQEITGAFGCEITFIVISLDFSLVQLFVPTWHTAVYKVLATGETVTELPVNPFDQMTDPAHPVAVIVTDEPEQTVVPLAIMTGAAALPTVIVNGIEEGLSQVPTLHTAV